MISDNLISLRKAKGYTQEKVASHLRVSRQAVAKWENGESTPDINNCAALASLYQVTLDDLVNSDAGEKGIPVPPKGKYVFGTVTMGERGQIVIPKKARDIFNMQPGDSLMLLGDEEQQGLAIARSDLFIGAIQEFMKFIGK